MGAGEEEYLKKLIDEGTAIVNIGGESTKPKTPSIDPATEWERMRHILETEWPAAKSAFRWTHITRERQSVHSRAAQIS
jgi:dihydropteroate synthase